MKRLICLIALAGMLAACSSDKSSTSADPLSGTWTGEWGPSPDRQTFVTLELKWDGTNLKATVNPGRSPIEASRATFDPQTQAITLELDAPGSTREIVRYVVKGEVSGDSMSGTFDRGGEMGIFKLEKS